MAKPLSGPSPPAPSGQPPRPAAAPPIPRRGFFFKASAIVLGGLVALVPALAGLAAFFDPLRRKSAAGAFIPVTPLDGVPDDGVPRQFSVIADRTDAWNRSREPVGAVYLRRVPGKETPECLTATCPHAGCFVAYDAPTGTFKCPCHNSSFTVDGQIIEPSPSPRAMDSLNCKVEGGEILVEYENFYTGKTEKVPKA